MKRTFAAPLLCLSCLALLAACRAERPPSTPAEDVDEESLVGAQSTYDEGPSADEAIDEKYSERAELPPPEAAKEKCSGKGKKRKCKKVDPKPGLSAAHGARKLMGRTRWKMDPKEVMDILAMEIDDEYNKKMEAAPDAVAQDEIREWKREQVDELGRSHIKFEARAHHKWGVSLIQFDYEDDANEEMVWIKQATLKKFYFFKDGELWKIVVAYNKQHWPNLDFKGAMNEKFMKWFGPSPEEKKAQDEETKAVLLTYNEWKSQEGERIRGFDMGEVHGVYVINMVDGQAEDYIGPRLPTGKKDETFNDDVSDALGGSDVCYDAEGNLIESAEKCKEIRGY